MLQINQWKKNTKLQEPWGIPEKETQQGLQPGQSIDHNRVGSNHDYKEDGSMNTEENNYWEKEEVSQINLS